jgi:uncharacterized protein
MAEKQARFGWYELMTSDRAAAEAFYRTVVGWQAATAPNAQIPYVLFSAGETPVAGLMDLPAEARAGGSPPVWLGYLIVDDVDEMTTAVEAAGGTTHVPPRDIPGVGRFSMVADPQGVTVGLFKWFNQGPAAPAEPQAPGYVGWHELLALDWPKALAFYADLFGWHRSTSVDMGDMGTYQLFQAGGVDIGGMFNKPDAVPVPFWLFYFNVDDIDAGAERVTGAGGQITNGPMEVPGGGWILQAMDPQGAMFALFGPKRS